MNQVGVGDERSAGPAREPNTRQSTTSIIALLTVLQPGLVTITSLLISWRCARPQRVEYWAIQCHAHHHHHHHHHAYQIAYRMWPTQGLARPLESIRQTLTKCRLIVVTQCSLFLKLGLVTIKIILI